MNYTTKKPLVRAGGNELQFIENNQTILNPAILIQPSLGLFLFAGESEETWKMKRMFESVQDPAADPNIALIVVPLGLNTPYGFSAKQAEYVINRMVRDVRNFVVQFYEHLCLDNDIREWLEDEMREPAVA
ncbi:MAG: hypothetical protein K2O18_13490 [Oscillospiraceae bacterium]|nr:hypothetical protein [Oscillospiraceae bacterium]